MENIKLNPGWEKLYHLNFPPKIPTVTPDVSSVVSELGQAVAASPAPASPPGGNNGKLGKKLLKIGGTILICYLGYRIYRYFTEDKQKND